MTNTINETYYNIASIHPEGIIERLNAENISYSLERIENIPVFAIKGYTNSKTFRFLKRHIYHENRAYSVKFITDNYVLYWWF